ncbi:ABC transporter ATP-binding protein [Thermodesulfobacteriota bacterium]
MLKILEVQEITKNFGGLTALYDVSFSLHEGETLGFIGPNGAGKTTLFNIICGMKPDSGAVLFNNEDITNRKPDKICHLGIARTFQLIRTFLNLTVLDNVACGLIFGRRKNEVANLKDARDKAIDVLKEVKLDHRAEKLAKELVFAERRRMEIARALATGPSLLLLDEVMAGLSSPEAQEMLEIMARVKADHKLTILMIEHTMKLVTAMCDRLVVINFGQKLTEGDPHEVLNDREVIKAYLGEEDAEAPGN